MRWTAEYLARDTVSDNYFLTVFADSINEATRLAIKWERKGFLLKRVVGC